MRVFHLLFITITLLMSSLVAAHQQKEAYTTVLFNNNTGNIEVSHRFYIHDAEHALGRILKKHTDIIKSDETQKDFANYIQQQFRLGDENKQLLELGSVGYEIEGKFFWVYQEIKQPKTIKSVYIQMRALQEVWPGQINQINVERDGKTRSVRLSDDDDWQKLTID